MEYRLTQAFQQLFLGTAYRHRRSGQGDALAAELYEDLYGIGRSQKYIRAADSGERALNTKNVRQGISARRGDGTFGATIPGEQLVRLPNFKIGRASVATLDIGVEVKIFNKAMIKQVNERITSLTNQADYFLRGRDGRARGHPITIAILGINYAEYATGYEGNREWRTDGTTTYAHPFQEAPEAQRRLIAELAPRYDELIILKYKATNEPPFPFGWVDERELLRSYGASLVRISQEFDKRF